MTGFGEGLTAPYKATIGAVTGGSGKYADPFEQGFFGSKYEDGIFPTYDPTLTGATVALQGSAGEGEKPALAREGETWDSYKARVVRDLKRPLREGEDRHYYDKFLDQGENGARLATETARDAADKGSVFGEYSPSKWLGLSKEGSTAMDIGGAGLLAYAGGLFEGEEPEQPVPSQLAGFVDDQVTAEQLLRDDPERFRIGLANLDPFATPPSEEETEVGSPYTFPYTMYGAHGGTVNYPRQTGHINGPGTATSDSIPAMLSNGEFVMTKRAVDGAGGPGTMYDLMRNFEMRT
jgi:hypothetical protein